MKQQHGVSLIEVMIALVVFAVGVGGMAGLQLRSLSMSMDSKQRAVVLAKSQELADRMRSNFGSLSAYVKDDTFDNSDGSYCSTEPAAICADSNSGSAASCSGEQMAEFDVWDVFCRDDSGMNDSVIDWRTDITCTSSPCMAGIDTVTISTIWVSRTGDTNKDLVVTTGANGSDPTQDHLILSFTP